MFKLKRCHAITRRCAIPKIVEHRRKNPGERASRSSVICCIQIPLIQSLVQIKGSQMMVVDQALEGTIHVAGVAYVLQTVSAMCRLTSFRLKLLVALLLVRILL